MAGFREVGLSVAAVFASDQTENPFSVQLRGQDLPEAVRIVLAVLDECRAAAIKLEKVELDAELYGPVRDGFAGEERIVSNEKLRCEAHFFRA